jgi:hypothetical protein
MRAGDICECDPLTPPEGEAAQGVYPLDSPDNIFFFRIINSKRQMPKKIVISKIKQ